MTIDDKALLTSGTLLIFANILSNISNFLFNAFLGRSLSVVDFGILTLFTSIFSLATIPMLALMTTVSHKIAFLTGRYSKDRAVHYLNNTMIRLLFLSAVVTLLWVLFIPLIGIYFQTETLLPYILFTPVWICGILGANVSGYLKGTLAFSVVALSTILSSLTKLVSAYLIIQAGLANLVYIALPLSAVVSLLVSYSFVGEQKQLLTPQVEERFNWSFFLVSIVTGISTIQFLGLDMLLVKHFLTPYEAGQYGLLSLAGKIVYFCGSLFLAFMIPLVARNEGAKRNSRRAFLFIFGITMLLTSLPILAFDLYGSVIVPMLFGAKAISTVPFLPVYLASVGLFTITTPVVYFYQAKQRYSYATLGFLILLLEIFLLSRYHHDLSQIVTVMFSVSVVNLFSIFILYSFEERIKFVLSNIRDFIGLFLSDIQIKSTVTEDSKNILIFNWRDTTHVWAGGAEKYIHELAKRWVETGYTVSVFCGNDGHQPRYQVIDGVKIIRRGGFYTVYLWAFLYFMTHFRKNVSVVIDSENGIPFFTPLYARKNKFLLIHHIHQEVFRTHLQFPFSYLAIFLESTIMSFVYRGHKVITVSNSSKKEIENLKFTDEKNITVVTPGVDLTLYKRMAKTPFPSLVYLGRLQPYKNTEVIIKAFKIIKESFSDAKLFIAGTGENLSMLKRMSHELHLDDSISFLGKVSEEEKIILLGTSWMMIQPSMIEGWGITVIEANASGTPVIASNVNGLKDSVRHMKTGILVEVGNIDEFVAAIALLLKDKNLRNTLSKDAYVWAQNFSWNKSFENIYKLVDISVRSCRKKKTHINF